jgi:pimeloyl-ACP methyl ester carboxylesterase
VHPDLEQWKAKGEDFDYLGFRVFFIKEGAGSNLLLVHGYPFNSYDWSGIWPELTSRFTVIAPDMLSMSFSDKPVGYEYSVHDHADMHEALLKELGVGACHVLCHDIGVSVVQEMLARHDDGEPASAASRIDSITWLNGSLFYEVYTPRLPPDDLDPLQPPPAERAPPGGRSDVQRRLGAASHRR